MRTKLLLAFLSLILLPLLTLGIMEPLIFTRSVESQATANTAQLVGQVSRAVDMSIQSIEKLGAWLAESPELQAFLKEGDRAGSPLRAGLERLSSTHPEIAGVMVVDRAGRYASHALLPITRDPLMTEAWYLAAMANPQRVHLFSRPILRNLRNNAGHESAEIVSMVKAISDHETGTVLGVMLMDFRVREIERLFFDTALGTQGFLFVSDARGETVYAPVNPVVYRIPQANILDTEHSSLAAIHGIDYRIISRQSDYTGWITTGVISITEMNREVDFLRLLSIVIGACTVAIAVGVAYFFMAALLRPVVFLQSLMKRAEEGDLSIRFPPAADVEIDRLGRGFNNMLDKIGKLIDQVYEDQHILRESELRMLQEQIKPHFLYNTLDTIRYMAQDGQAQEIVEVVEALTSFFRIGLSRGSEMIPLEAELDHVRNYLTVQKARYEDKFEFELHQDPDTKSCMVLKLLLQPLVENAIYHGIKERRGKGRLTVCIHREADSLVMEVADDGVGMSEERCGDLNQRLAGGESGKEAIGYGVFNIHERIRLRFGVEWGLSFASAPGRGCVVTLRHPVTMREELPCGKS